MKRRKRADRRQATLKGWWKALPFLLIPFGAFLTETWLHTQIMTNGVRASDLTSEIETLKVNIIQLEADLSRETTVAGIRKRAERAEFIRPIRPSILLEISREVLNEVSGRVEDEARESD